MSTLPNNKYLSIHEAADLLRVSTKTLRRWEDSGKLVPERTDGGHRRYTRILLDSFKSRKSPRPVAPKPAPKPYQAFAESEPKEVFTATTESVTQPEIFHPLHINQVKVLKRGAFAGAVMLVLLVATSFAKQNPVIRTFLDSANEDIAEKETANPNVLATRDSLLTTQLNINVDTDISGNLNLSGNTISSAGDIVVSPGGGGISIGGGTPDNIDLDGDDLFVSGDFEAAGDVFAVNGALTGALTVTGEATVGSLTLNAETITDLTGTGITITDGALSASLGTSITSAEIEDGTITEADLNVTNTPTDNQILSFDDATDTFTWVDVSAGESSPWTDNGTLIVLDTTTDNLSIGGSTDLAKLAVDGDTDEIQFLVQANATQTTDLVVFEDSSGTDLLSLSGAGVLTIPGLDCTGNSNGGALTANASGVISCSDDDGGGSAVGWTDDGTLVRLDTSTDNVTIGSASELGKLGIDGDTDEIQLLVQGNATQTTNLVVFETSAGTDLFTLTNAGVATLTGNFNANGGFDVDDAFAVADGGVLTTSQTANFDGAVDVDGAADFSAGLTNSAGELLVSGGNLQLNDSINLTLGTGDDLTLVHNGTNSFITSATGDLIVDNTLATGSSIFRLGTDTAATDFQVQNNSESALFTVLGTGIATFTGNVNANGGFDVDDAFAVADGGVLTTSQTANFDGTVDVDGAADFSAGLTNSAGELLISGGNLQLNDSINLTLGTGDDLTLVHNGTNTIITSATGDLIVDNTLATGSSIFRLGTDTTATDFQVQNNSESALLTVDGSGVATFTGNVNANGGIDVDDAFSVADGGVLTTSQTANFDGTADFDGAVDFSAGVTNSAGEHLFSGGNLQLNDSINLTLGTGDDLTLVHNGTNTLITSTTGDLIIDNTLATGSTIFDLGTDTSATDVLVRNNSGVQLFSINGAGAAQIGSNGQDGQLIIYNELGVTDRTNTFNPSTSQSQDITYTLPPDDGTSDFVLVTDGAGVLTWQDVTGVGGAGDITSVGNITSGAAFTSGVPGSELYFVSTGFLGLGGAAGRITFTDATPDIVDIEDANLDLNANTLTGTTAAIDFTNFDVTSAGVTTIVGNLNANGGLDVDDAFAVADGGVLTTSQTANFDGTVDVDGAADFSANITNSAGELLVSGGNLQLNDSINLTLGTGDDLTLVHNGTNTLITSTTGDLIIDNTLVTGSTIFDLGTDTSATDVLVRNNSGTQLLSINGAGAVQLGSAGLDGQLIIYNDLATDRTITFNPSASQTADITYTLPPDDGDTNFVLTTNGTGTLAWSSVSGAGGVDETGTNANSQIAYFTDDNTITSEAGFTWDETNDLLTFTPTTTGTVVDFVLETEWTAGDLINADFASATTQTAALAGIDLDFSNLTSVAGSTTYGLHINDLAAQTTSTEYAIYQEGTNWDFGLFVEDAAQLNTTLDVNGDSTLSNVTLDANANLTLTSGTGAYTQTYAGTSSAFTQSITSNVTDTSNHEPYNTTFVNARSGAGNLIGVDLQLTQNPSVAGNSETLFRMFLASTSNTTDTSINRLLQISNADTDAVGETTVDDGIQIIATTDGGIVDAIDVSDAELDNAVNAGQNFILGSGIRQFSSSSTVWTFEDTSGNDLLTITDAGTTGDLVSSGNITSTGDFVVNGNTTIGNANTDTLTINAGTSGTGISLTDASFDTCTALETVGGVLTCGSDAGGSSTPGGNDTEIQYNNGGAFGGVSVFTYNDATGALSITDDIDLTFAGTENLAITSDLAGSVDVVNITTTPSGSAGTTTGIYLDQADSANSNGLDTAIAIDNSDTDLAIPTGINFINAGGGFTTGISFNGVTTDIAVGTAGEALTIDVAGGNASGEDFVLTAHNLQVAATGAMTISPDAALTTAIDLTDTDLTNAISLADNNITGTTWSALATTSTLTLDAASSVQIDGDTSVIFQDATTTYLTLTQSGTQDVQYDAAGNDHIFAASDLVTITGVEGSNVLSLTAGDQVISDGSITVTDDDNAASLSVTNNTANTIGASASAGVANLVSTSLTTGSLLNLELTEGTLAGGHYLKAWDATAAGTVFSVGEDGNTTITGVEGSNMFTLTAGDAVVSDGSLLITDDDDAVSFGVTNNTATTIGAGVNTAGIVDLASTSLTTGNLLNLEANGLTTGIALNVGSTTTDASAVTSGLLGYFNWNPGSSTTKSGDLFRINIGSNGNVTNLLNVTDNGSSLFSVGEATITSAIPHSFTAAGDVTVAYDLLLSNQTASTVKSNAPLTIEAGESSENNNLTLKTYGTGKVIVDGGFSLNTQETLSANDTTPSVGGTSHFITANTGATTISTFDDGVAGQIVVVEVNDANTTFNCTTMNCGSGNITAADGDVLTFIYNGAVWNMISNMDDSLATGTDLAEWFPTNGELAAGEVVSIDSSQPVKVQKAAQSDGQRVIGVVSTQPGIILGAQEEGVPAAMVALAGRVPVKVDPTSKAIQNGDLIGASTTLGLAQKETGGWVIGRALESWTPGSGQETVTIFVNPIHVGEAQLATGYDDRITSLENDMAILQAQLDLGEEGATTESFTDLSVTNLNVLGDTVLGNTVVNGQLNVGTLTFDNVDQSINAVGVLKIQDLALGNIEFLGGLIVFDTEGNIVANEITAEKFNVAGASAGEGTLPAGEKEVFVETTAITENSLVFITPKRALAFPLAITEKDAGSGFWVELPAIQSSATEFDWFIVDKQ